MALEFSDILKKIKAQFVTITGDNYFFTPPIIKVVNNRKFEIFFAYKISMKQKILRPYLKLATDFNGGFIVEFKNAYYSEFADNKKYPLNLEFNASVPVAKSVKEQTDLLKKLNLLYEKVRQFAFAGNLSNDERNILADYSKILTATVPVDLLNFCRDTEPDFFNWIRRNI